MQGAPASSQTNGTSMRTMRICAALGAALALAACAPEEPTGPGAESPTEAPAEAPGPETPAPPAAPPETTGPSAVGPGAAPPPPSATTPPRPPKPAPAPAPAPARESTVPAPAPPEGPAAPTEPASAPLDLESLGQRLQKTDAIGIFTKLKLKNEFDDLLADLRAAHDGRSNATPASLRERYDLLLMKVLAVLDDRDPRLAHDLTASREAIWKALNDPATLAGSS